MDFQLDTVIEVLLSPDNQRRIQAESFVEQIPTNHFQQGIDAFLMSMHHENPHVASMAALLLKKKYLQPEDISKKMTIQQLEYIVKSVQGCMVPEKSLMFLKRCCDILVKVYNQANQQRELITLIQSLSSSQMFNMKMTLFYLIEMICECSLDDNLHMEYSGALESIFQRGMEDENNQVKVAGFKALTIFLSSIKNEKIVKKFEGVLQLLINKAIELIKYDQESGVTALESMNQLIETHPKFVKPVLPQLLSIYTEIMEASSLLVNLRSTAMYGILILCMNHAAAIRKLSYFQQKMVPVYMQMLAEIDNLSIEEWSEELNDEIISKNDISLSAQENLGQITLYLTNKFMLPKFIPHIQQYLASPEISHQHAGLVAMALMTEDCHQSFKKELNNILSLIMPLLQTSNPRIMHDILMALGYMSEQFTPELQQNHGEIILKFILHCLQFPALKVQFKASQCLINFEKGIAEHKEIKIIEQFLPSIMQQIGRLFEFSISKMNFILLDAVLDTLATIADLNPFDQYYPVFMPGLKKILGMIGTDNPQQIMARSKTVETMGFLLASVKQNPQIFEPDCQEIMKVLIDMSMKMENDDPLHKAMFVVYENVVTSMKGNFLVYSDYVFTKVIEAANRKIELTIIEQDDPSATKIQGIKANKHNYATYKLDMKVDGVKNLVLNTDHLAQKIGATNLLVQMAEDMGQSFGKYIEPAIPTVKELISYKNNKTIRCNMIQAVKYMLRDCQNNEQKTYLLQHVFDSICYELSLVIRQKDGQQMSNIIELFAEAMPFMTQEMAVKLPEMLMAALNFVKTATKQIQKEYADKEMDEATEQEMGEQIEQVQEVLEHIETIIKNANGIPQFLALKEHFPKEYQFDN